MVASKTKIPRSTYDALKRGDNFCCKNSSKPLLIKLNIFDCIGFSFSFIKRMPRQNQFVFDNMRNVVHDDEKWFYLKIKIQ